MESALAPHTRRLTLPRSPKLLSLLGDERLVNEVRAGNEAAFEAVYDRYHRPLLSFCRHLLGSQAEAEDALQQTFASAYSALLSSDGELRLKPWLFTIARNRCLSMLRRRPTEELADDPPTAGLHEQVSERAELRELLGDLRRLPEDQRAALILSELRGFSHEDVAEVVGCAPVKVKSLVFQARSHLLEFREARATPCTEIREELSVRRRGAPSRRVRQHVAECAGCAEFRERVRKQRSHLAVLLAVAPALGLRSKALAAAGVAGGGGAAGGVASGGGFAWLSGAKLAAAVVGAAGVATVGAVATEAPGGARADRPAGVSVSAPPLFPLPGADGRGLLLSRHTAALTNRSAAAYAGTRPRRSAQLRASVPTHVRHGAHGHAGHRHAHMHPHPVPTGGSSNATAQSGGGSGAPAVSQRGHGTGQTHGNSRHAAAGASTPARPVHPAHPAHPVHPSHPTGQAPPPAQRQPPPSAPGHGAQQVAQPRGDGAHGAPGKSHR